MGRHVFGYDASSADHCVFSNGDSSKQSGAGLDRDALTDERVAANLAAVADFCPFLDFNERAYFGFVADLATVKVHESPNLHVATQLHIGRDSLVIRSRVVHTGIGSARRSSLLHTRSPDENSGCDREKLTGAPWLLS